MQFHAILSAEKKITFRRDLELLPTENTKRTLEDVFRREYTTEIKRKQLEITASKLRFETKIMNAITNHCTFKNFP